MAMGYVANSNPTTQKTARQMSVDEFMKSAGSEEVQKLFSRINTGSFSACHTAFYQATGIWIPELVPVFKKLDAMMVLGEETKPADL